MKENIAKKYKAIQADINKKLSTGKLYGLTYRDMLSICDAGKELVKRHTAKTFIKNVADYFESFGFKVTQDFDGVNYVIVEV